MNLITEEKMKNIIKTAKNIVDGQVKLPLGSLLTPAAQTVLSDHKLGFVLTEKIIETAEPEKTASVIETAEIMAAKSLGKFVLENGGFLNEKPEHMTQLFGNLLVLKDNKLIKLRGEVDILMSEIMKVQITAEKHNLHGLVTDLQDVCNYIGQLQRCEILNEEMNDCTILNLNYDEIREMSHHPKKYFGKEHLFHITWQMGEIPILLNSLRAMVRKIEIACYEAFKTESGEPKRGDLVQGFNRLSSVFYIITFKYLTKQY